MDLDAFLLELHEMMILKLKSPQAEDNFRPEWRYVGLRRCPAVHPVIFPRWGGGPRLTSGAPRPAVLPTPGTPRAGLWGLVSVGFFKVITEILYSCYNKCT